MNVSTKYIKNMEKEKLMDKLKTIVQALDEKLAHDIVILDMSLNSPICDYFVIATAQNERLMQALKDNVEEKCELNGYELKNIEGLKKSKWLLMDYSDIVIHIFDAEERKNYNIEKLWSDMPRLNVEELLK